jgi:hypothetical protein
VIARCVAPTVNDVEQSVLLGFGRPSTNPWANRIFDEILELLILHGADINAGAEFSRSPLLFAKARGRPTAALILVKHGAKE